tara:strand:- start:17527 stop:17952 length:426 start_codon:yes stop_codon:yes gene_type:complete
MDPATAAVALKAGSAIGGAFASRSQGIQEQKNANLNAFIGRTRALQTDTAARQSLSSELASARNAFAANGDNPSVGTFGILNEIRTAGDRNRRIAVGNEKSAANDYTQAGINARAKGQRGFVSGLAKAGPSLFQIASLAGA